MFSSSLFVISAVCLLALFVDIIGPSLSHANNASLLEKVNIESAPIVIVISFDGFRYDYLESVGRPTPNFDAFIKNGVRAKWMKNVFVTKTFPNHFSIATGLYEETHGVLGNYMFDPVLNETFYVNNTSPLWWDNGFNTPIWIANQNGGKNRVSGCVMWSGCNVAYRNRKATYFYPYNDSVIWNERVDVAIDWITLDDKPANLVMLYVEEPDGVGHVYGPDSKEVAEKVVEADNMIGYLMGELDKRALLDVVNVIILSDHGMATIRHEIEMDSILNRSSYRQYGHTPVWNIQAVEGMEDYVYQHLLEGSKMYEYTLYKKDEIPEEYHFKHNRRMLHFLIVADESYDLVFVKTKSDRTSWGNHGYNNSMKSMHPIFFAKGPRFKKGYTSEPFLNLDVYPLMCHILGIKTPLNNGSFDRVKHLLATRSVPTNVSGGSWVVVVVFLLCVSISGALTSSAISTFCKYKSPTIAYVTLRKQNLRKEKEMSTVDEMEQLLDEGSTD